MQNVLISDTALRSFISPQVREMTTRLCQICGCELCIIPNYMQVSLNIFRTKLVTDLQKISVGRHTRNITFSNTSSAHYKDNFSGWWIPHDTIKDAAQCISFTPIKPNNNIHIKCALVFCGWCPEYTVMYQMLH